MTQSEKALSDYREPQGISSHSLLKAVLNEPGNSAIGRLPGMWKTFLLHAPSRATFSIPPHLNR